jgi:hypothetical protein
MRKEEKGKIGGRDDECFEMSCWPIKEKQSGVDGFTDAVNGGVANEVPRASIKGGIVGLAVGCVGEEFHQRRQLQTWFWRKGRRWSTTKRI